MSSINSILFDPPKIKRSPASSLLFRESIYYPWDAQSFFFEGDTIWIADGEQIYQKDLGRKGKKARKTKAKEVRSISEIGAIAFGEKTAPTFYGSENIFTQSVFSLGQDGLRKDPVHILVAQKAFDKTEHGINFYAIDNAGDLYWRALEGGEDFWQDAYNSTEAKIHFYLSGPQGSIFVRGTNMILLRQDSVFVEVKENLSEKSPLLQSKKFVQYQDGLLFLGQDGRLQTENEEIWCKHRDIQDISASEDTLALLGKDNILILYNKGKMLLKEPLQNPYQNLLLHEDRLLLFGGLSADGDHLDQADLYNIS